MDQEQHSTKDERLELVHLYKKYLLTHGKLPESFHDLMAFGSLDLAAFRMHFRSLEELEVAILLRYFKEADDLLAADEGSAELSHRERHLAFCYLLIEQAETDEVFLQEFTAHKKKSPSFLKQFAMALNAQELQALHTSGKMNEAFAKINLNPKKTALTNHLLAVLWFFLRDRSEAKQDTDAFIEKSTDLLFRLTDTSTLMSMFDLGKFMVSRQKSAFTW